MGQVFVSFLTRHTHTHKCVCVCGCVCVWLSVCQVCVCVWLCVCVVCVWNSFSIGILHFRDHSTIIIGPHTLSLSSSFSLFLFLFKFIYNSIFNCNYSLSFYNYYLFCIPKLWVFCEILYWFNKLFRFF